MLPRRLILMLVIAGLSSLAGCTSAPSHAGRHVEDWKSAEFSEPSTTATTTALSAAPVVPAPSPSIPVPPREAMSKPVSQFTDTWVPLIRWCKVAGISEPDCVTSASGPSYTLRSTNGTFVFHPGTQIARWEGVEVLLGFSPQMIDRKPYLHHLDLSKTVLPLLAGGALHCTNASPVIVLDPGHGGQDAGARSALSRAWEKQFTLDWARRLQVLLVTNGWQVYLTRTDDREIPLSNRVAFAQERKADLFVSLHFNSAGTDLEQAGLETYCLTPTGMPSALTRGYGDDLQRSFPNNAFDAENVQLAYRVHRNLLQVNGNRDRGVRRARFLGVLRNQQRPAVLIEGGYLSNKREAFLISDPAYRQKLAEAVARGLLP